VANNTDTGSDPPRLKRSPPPYIWKGLLAIGVLARVAAESQASEARALARAEAAKMAAEESRLRAEKNSLADSIRLTTAVDSGTALSSERAWQLDRTLHSASFAIPHDSLHRRVVNHRLDSTARVLRRAAKDVAYASAARALLSTIQAPLTPAQAKRESELSSRMHRIDRRLTLEASRREARARALDESPKTRRQLGPGRGLQAPRTRIPPGASARCADGSYSFSASRRGTCSRHGGVAEWL
jgi:hypothetical protein